MDKLIIKIFYNTLIIIIFFLLLSNHLLSKNSNDEKSRDTEKMNYCISLYNKLQSSSIKNKSSFSNDVIENLYYFYQITKDRTQKGRALYYIGSTYYYLTKYYNSEIYADLTIGIFSKLLKELPDSSYSDDAKYYIADVYFYHKNIPKLAINELKDSISKYPKGDFYQRSLELLKKIEKKVAYLEKIKIKIKKNVVPQDHKKDDKKVNKKIEPEFRSDFNLEKVKFVNLKNLFRYSVAFQKLPEYSIVESDGTVTLKLSRARFSTNFKNTPEYNAFKKYFAVSESKDALELTYNIPDGNWVKAANTYILKNPLRIVVDIEFDNIASIQSPNNAISTIIIDPGHGGHDPGATYYGVEEKDVALKISNYIKYFIYKLSNNKFKVLLTRTTDEFLSLEDRSYFANKSKADLFISIHCNASRNEKTYGFETYYLRESSNKKYLQRKMKQLDETNFIIEDLVRTSKMQESVELANSIHKKIINNLRKSYSDINDLGIKEAPFFVLYNTKMPSVLAEISFLSHKMENQRLQNQTYLKSVARAIAEGILDYIQKNGAHSKK